MTVTDPPPAAATTPLPAAWSGLREQSALVSMLDRALPVLELDADGTVIRVGPALAAAVGHDAGDLVGRPYACLLPDGAEAEEELARLWAMLASGAPVSGEVRRVSADGRPVWLEATHVPVLDDDGALRSVTVVAVDVTRLRREAAELAGTLTALDRAQAVAEFDLDGRLLTANATFLDVMGYTLGEVQGRHHRLFCDDELAASRDYLDFWERLGKGHVEGGELRQLGKGAREVWLQATYNPVVDDQGRPVKILAFATDITAAKRVTADFLGKVAAIERSQAVIEFDLQGRVVEANQNFLDVVGYSLAEVQGQHHRMFCEPEVAQSQEYADFWERLVAGQFESGEFRRLGKGGREVWLQATYNPILDPSGRPMKVVKFAADVTAAKLAAAEVQARANAIDRAQAVIEFDLDGNVLSANENFLRTMGYSIREIVGQHHSTFCAEDYRRSAEYRDFWMRLGKGEVIAGRFHRVGKYGRDVHIQATYNPVLDLSGRPMKVVKYAYDVSDEVEREQRVSAGTNAMTETVRELAESIAEIAEESQTATELAAETHANAEHGVEALRASIEAITLIQRSSASISDIAKVISAIAEQTNLLAFNASIEAARAGEHGVGFSIVAGEVRKLAERSSEAAQQIGRLIGESADRVDQGSAVSKRAETAFERIVTSVGRTNDAIRAISTSTRVQQDASERVNSLIDQLAGDALPAAPARP